MPDASSKICHFIYITGEFSLKFSLKTSFVQVCIVVWWKTFVNVVKSCALCTVVCTAVSSLPVSSGVIVMFLTCYSHISVTVYRWTVTQSEDLSGVVDIYDACTVPNGGWRCSQSKRFTEGWSLRDLQFIKQTTRLGYTSFFVVADYSVATCLSTSSNMLVLVNEVVYCLACVCVRGHI